MIDSIGRRRVDKKQKPTNSNWGKPANLTELYGAQHICEFDKLVGKLGLQPEQYEQSEVLRAWVKRHYKQRYVPEYLLLTWNIASQFDIIENI